MKYVKFREYNDNEGESWNFYIPIEGNETVLKEFAEIIESNDEEHEFYQFDEEHEFSEQEVDTLVKFGGQGYMNNHNKLSGKLVIPDFVQPGDEDENPLIESLYKGGIKDWMK